MGSVVGKYRISQGMLQKLNDKRRKDARVSMEIEKSEKTVMRQSIENRRKEM